ncbi:MAG: hypothetical protein ACLFQE_08360 [Thermotogota bacterium]
MPKFRIIDSAMFLIKNYTPQQIETLKQHNIINSRVLLALEAKRVFDTQKSEKTCDKYEYTAMEMGLSVRYVRKLLNE